MYDARCFVVASYIDPETGTPRREEPVVLSSFGTRKRIRPRTRPQKRPRMSKREKTRKKRKQRKHGMKRNRDKTPMWDNCQDAMEAGYRGGGDERGRCR